MSAPAQTIHSQLLVDDDDFWRVQRLLEESYPVIPLGFNWDVRRWQGKRFYNEDENGWHARFDGRICLWETGDGCVVGAVNPEGQGDAHLQLHPDYRFLEEEMITWAEQHLTAPTQDDEHRQLEFFVYDYDTPRQQLLTARGYTKMPFGGVIRRMSLAGRSLVQPALAEGYTLRTTQPDDLQDCQRIADLLNCAFNRTFHNALEYQMFTRHAPCFQPKMDLVAVAADGSFAAYVGVPYDEANRHGIFEPVCTHPEHRQRGLAQALMHEGLLRLQARGALDVIVDTGDMIPANRLYDSLGFDEVCKGYAWQKVFYA
jgi:mycothiol synthase